MVAQVAMPRPRTSPAFGGNGGNGGAATATGAAANAVGGRGGSGGSAAFRYRALIRVVTGSAAVVEPGDPQLLSRRAVRLFRLPRRAAMAASNLQSPTGGDPGVGGDANATADASAGVAGQRQPTRSRTLASGEMAWDRGAPPVLRRTPRPSKARWLRRSRAAMEDRAESTSQPRRPVWPAPAFSRRPQLLRP